MGRRLGVVTELGGGTVAAGLHLNMKEVAMISKAQVIQRII